MSLLSCTTDFFGNVLHKPLIDTTLQKLQQPPKDETLFSRLMKVCLQSAVGVLERQYKKYFECNVTEKLRAETKSARSHNIDAEELMGMFSAAQKKAPNATLCFLPCKMRAQKNRTVEFLDAMEEERRDIILKNGIVRQAAEMEKES